MFKIIPIILFYLSFAIVNSYSQEKIVFIDINYIFKNSIAGKDLNNQISKKEKELNLEVSKFRSEIEKERIFYLKKMYYLLKNIIKKVKILRKVLRIRTQK